MNNFKKKELIVNGIRVSYYENSTESDFVLLFLHGWKGDALLWSGVLESFSSSYHCIALDFPGFGSSELPPSSADLSFFATFIQSFITKLLLKHVILVGHSFGGRVSLKLSYEAHDWLSGVVLVNAAGKEDRGLFKYFKIVVAKVLKPLFIPRFMQPLRRKIYELIGASDYVTSSNLRKVFVRIIGEDLTHVLPFVRVPALVISGAQDREVSKSFTYALRDAIPNADFFMFPKAGHFAFLDEPQLFSIAVLDFIKERVNK